MSAAVGKNVAYASRAVAAAFAFAAVWHLTAMAVPSFAATSYSAAYPPWRHVAFVLINVGCAWLFLSRPPWAIWPYGPVAIQALYGHGANALRLWRQESRVDWVSVATVTITLLAVATAADGWRNRSRKSASAGKLGVVGN